MRIPVTAATVNINCGTADRLLVRTAAGRGGRGSPPLLHGDIPGIVSSLTLTVGHPAGQQVTTLNKLLRSLAIFVVDRIGSCRPGT